MADVPEPPRDFATLYRTTLAPLRRYLARLLGNATEAQDIAHDAYRRSHLAAYREESRYADGTLAGGFTDWANRSLQRYSVFGELRAPLLAPRFLPAPVRTLDADLAVPPGGATKQSNWISHGALRAPRDDKPVLYR